MYRNEVDSSESGRATDQCGLWSEWIRQLYQAVLGGFLPRIKGSLWIVSHRAATRWDVHFKQITQALLLRRDWRGAREAARRTVPGYISVQWFGSQFFLFFFFFFNHTYTMQFSCYLWFSSDRSRLTIWHPQTLVLAIQIWKALYLPIGRKAFPRALVYWVNLASCVADHLCKKILCFF